MRAGSGFARASVLLLAACDSATSSPVASSSGAAPASLASRNADAASAAETNSATGWEPRVRSAGPSVVGVVSRVQRDGETLRGIGSGFVVGPNEVLTNAHVVHDASDVKLETDEGEWIDGAVVHSSRRVDLALIRSARPLGRPALALQPEAPQLGAAVMAIGQPFGLGQSVTVGVVSGLDRDHQDLGTPAGLAADGAWNFIQTDASINIGNSGGPLLGLDGRVVGITTAARTDGQGLAFAIPAAMGARFVADVRDHGRLRRVRLGLTLRDHVPSPEGDDPRSGVDIVAVAENGPGAQAGLHAGTRLVRLNDRPLRRASRVAYASQVAGVGGSLELTALAADGTLRSHTLRPAAADGP